jgi:hypothetical protein
MKKYTVRMPIAGHSILCGDANSLPEAHRIVFKEKYEMARWSADLLKGDPFRYVFTISDKSGRVIEAY